MQLDKMYSHLFLQVVTGSLGTSTNLERWTDISSYPPHMQPNFDSGRMREAVKDSIFEELKFQGSHFFTFSKVDHLFRSLALAGGKEVWKVSDF